eukprot:gene11460-17627_t
MSRRVLVWLRQDLRLLDHPALHHASKNQCLPVYIYDNATVPHGGASKWWLHHSLTSLRGDLGRKGYNLQVYNGDPLPILRKLVAQNHINEVVWSRCYEPAAIKRDSTIKSELEKMNVTVQSFNGTLLHEPWEVQTKTGTPFKVFTPYWRACLQKPPAAALPEIANNASTTREVLRAIDEECETIQNLNLLPTKPDWAGGLRESWVPGEAKALERANEFVKKALDPYKRERDLVCKPSATSRLSPHLHFGEISPRTLWEKVHAHAKATGQSSDGATHYLSELGWREFSYHLLYHFPNMVKDPFRADFRGFQWRNDDKALKAWQKGNTGVPMVDAAMRELWHTGYMHNRSRMVVASFLTKNLLLHWHHGADWFWDTLVDADQANNTAGWQWVAGCGADAAPYFRIFNPVLQGEKFDADGEYVRKWVPELRNLCNRYVHKPWEAPESVLSISKVVLGKTYPRPIVDVKESRQRALARTLASFAADGCVASGEVPKVTQPQLAAALCCRDGDWCDSDIGGRCHGDSVGFVEASDICASRAAR